MNAWRALPVFSAAFAALYVVCMYFNLAFVTYYPRTHTWYWMRETGLPREAGPGMYWYGWLVTAALGAAAVAALSLLAPARAGRRGVARASWAVPAIAMGVLAFLLRSWFIH